MSETRMNTYEGLFLFPQSATANLQAAVDHITDILNRSDARIQTMRKWDERRLAYEIKGNKRGVYFLVYFQCDGAKITEIERRCNLSDDLLRAMILRASHLPQEQIEAADDRARLEDEIRMRGEEGEKTASAATTSTATSSTGTSSAATSSEGAARESSTSA